MIKNYVVDKTDEYTIDYRPQADGTIKMFATDHPHDPYGKPVSENHLFSTNEICVTSGHEPRTMDRAKALAVHFMEGYSQYVRTGEFPKGSRRVHV